MKLYEVHDGPNRREFLKTAGSAAIAAASGNVAKVADTAKTIAPLSAATAERISRFIWDVMDSDYAYRPAAIELLASDNAPSPQQVVDTVRMMLNGDIKSTDNANFLSVLDSIGTIDEYTDGGVSAAINDYINKIGGPARVIKMIFDYNSSVDMPFESLCSSLSALGRVASGVAKIIPDSMLRQAMDNGSIKQLVSQARKFKIIDDRQAKELLEKEYQRHIRAYNNKREYENRRKQLTDIKPRHDDYIYGSPMHQPFESRLTKVLTIFG